MSLHAYLISRKNRQIKLKCRVFFFFAFHCLTFVFDVTRYGNYEIFVYLTKNTLNKRFEYINSYTVNWFHDFFFQMVSLQLHMVSWKVIERYTIWFHGKIRQTEVDAWNMKVQKIKHMLQFATLADAYVLSYNATNYNKRLIFSVKTHNP